MPKTRLGREDGTVWKGRRKAGPPLRKYISFVLCTYFLFLSSVIVFALFYLGGLGGRGRGSPTRTTRHLGRFWARSGRVYDFVKTRRCCPGPLCLMKKDKYGRPHTHAKDSLHDMIGSVISPPILAFATGKVLCCKPAR